MPIVLHCEELGQQVYMFQALHFSFGDLSLSDLSTVGVCLLWCSPLVCKVMRQPPREMPLPFEGHSLAQETRQQPESQQVASLLVQHFNVDAWSPTQQRLQQNTTGWAASVERMGR